MAKPVCPRCGLQRARRIQRVGFFQCVVFPLFGYFPWECAACRREFLFRGRSDNRTARQPREDRAGGSDRAETL